jgi:recombination protein RecA
MSEALKKMTDFLAKMNKKFKEQYHADTILTADKVGNFLPLSTGFPTIDWGNSGIGGLPRGGFTLVHGLESTGKTTLMLEAIAYMQKADPEFTCFFVDVENSLTDQFLKFKGIDSSRMAITNLNNEDALFKAEEAIKANIFDLIIIDSFAKLESKKVTEKAFGEATQRGRRAVMITEFLNRNSFVLRKSKTALVAINQEVENQEAAGKPFAPKTKLPGGKQQLFSANLRLHLARAKSIGKEGFIVNVTSKKNKIAGNEKVCTQVVYIIGRGFMRHVNLVDYLVSLSYVKKLPAGRYEFIDKDYYPKPFRVVEMLEIAEQIKATHGLDLYTVKPEGVVFQKDQPAEEGESDVVADDE